MRNVDIMRSRESVMVAVNKHISRGIRLINTNDYCGGLPSHQCELHELCPHTLRFVDDKYSLTLMVALEDNTLDCIRGTVWRYGGERCFDGTRGLDALFICNSGIHYNEKNLVRVLCPFSHLTN